MRTLQEWYRYVDQQAHLAARLRVSAASGSAPPQEGTQESAGRSRTPAAPQPSAPGLTGRRQARRSLATRPASRRPRRLGRPRLGRNRDAVVRRLLDPEVSLHDAAMLLRVSKSTLRRYTRTGKVPAFRTPGGQRRFRLSDLMAFLEAAGRA